MSNIITIDGPAGSGKSTIASQLAARTGIPYLNTGMLYRAIAFAARRAGVQPVADAALDAFLADVEITLTPDGSGGFEVCLNSTPCEIAQLRTSENSAAASEFSALPPVREKLLDLQRGAGKHGVIVEGRDTGSVVFPGADVKVFLTADPHERARRRAVELGRDPDDAQVLADIEARDARDQGREIAPLVVPDGAHQIDTTSRSVEQIIEHLLQLLG